MSFCPHFNDLVGGNNNLHFVEKPVRYSQGSLRNKHKQLNSNKYSAATSGAQQQADDKASLV